jgi:hypothetical protein
MRSPLVLGAVLWLAALTLAVGWLAVRGEPSEQSPGNEREVLLCEDALERRRTSEQALARLGRERVEVMVDARRLSEIFEAASADVDRYCFGTS